MRDLILHIGWPKTGTTSLQAHLFSAGEELAGQGAAYYASHGNTIGGISRAITNRMDLSHFRRKFDKWLAGQAAGKIILSSEGLAMNDCAEVFAFLRPEIWRSIRVICYLREQVGYLEGIYKQSVKWGSRPDLGSLVRGRTGVSVDYDRQLARWERWCNEVGAELSVRLFQRQDLIGGEIRTDFYAICGLAPPQALAPASNISPSKALIDLYLALPRIERLQQINRIMVASGLPGVTGSGDLFDEEQRLSIESRYAASNAALCERLFPERQTLFAPQPECAPAPKAEIGPIRDLLLATIAERRPIEVAEAARVALLGPGPHGAGGVH